MDNAVLDLIGMQPAGDPDGDGDWTQADLIYLFHYLFEGGPPPCGGEKN